MDSKQPGRAAGLESPGLYQRVDRCRNGERRSLCRVSDRHFQPMGAVGGELPGDFAPAAADGYRLEQATRAGSGEEDLDERWLPVEIVRDRNQVLSRIQTAVVVGDPAEEVAEKGIEWRGNVWRRGSAGAGGFRSAHGAVW